jgi:predicted aspartyl protease
VWLFGLTLFVIVWFDGVPVECVVDTGSEATLLREAAAARLGTLEPVLFETSVRVASGATIPASARRVPHVGTADLGWPEALVLVVPDEQLSAPCILGTDLLGRQPIVIDWDAGRITAR